MTRNNRKTGQRNRAENKKKDSRTKLKQCANLFFVSMYNLGFDEIKKEKQS